MKIYMPPPVSDETIQVLRDALAAGSSQADIIARMRALGLNQGRSVLLLPEITGTSHREAKMAVHCSETWADCLQSNEMLHDAAEAAAKDLGFVDAEMHPLGENAETMQSTR